ncbi:MAG: thiol reductant ABC exporter subunit CydD [Actinomycetota bacterium]|nr:thiol reductant ABC exporter subunit CydD [Actinomycetota bacterium]
MSWPATLADRAPFDSRLLPYVAPARKELAAVVGLGLVSTVATAAQAVLLARIVASAFVPGYPTESRSWMLGALGAVSVARGGCSLASEVLARRAATRVTSRMRSDLVSCSLSRRAGAGELATTAGRGLDALETYVARCVPDLVLAATSPLVLVAAVAYEDWLSAVVLVVAVALFPLFGALVGRTTGARARARWSEVVRLGEHLVDLFAGLPVLRAYGRVADERARVAQIGESIRASSLATLRLALVSGLVLDTLASVTTALVAVPIGLRLAAGAMALAPGLAVLAMTPEVLLPLRRASAQFHESAEGLAAAGRALELLGPLGPRRAASSAELTRSRASERGDDVRGAGPRGAVSRPSRHGPSRPARVALEGAGVAGPDRASGGPWVVEDVTLEVGPGEVVALVGPNGAGKSTVLELVLGLVLPTRGAVTVDGARLEDGALEPWRLRCAYLPDRPTVIPATLEENLLLASPGSTRDELESLVGELHLDALVARLPEGLATRVGDGGSALSAGERQRVALGRALLRRAGLYVLDEPTEHLDEAVESAAVGAIARRLRGAGALVVTHRPAVLRLADRVVEMDAGRVVGGLPARPSRPARAAGIS